MNIHEQYERGLPGAVFRQEKHDALMDQLQFKAAAEVATRYGFADQFAGKLVVPFVHVMEAYARCWPGAAQGRGDCVSHANKNALLGSTVADVIAELIDEVTGKLETLPVVSPAGIEQGVMSTETLYWFSGNGNRKSARGYAADGWSSAECLTIARTKAGAVIRGPLGSTGIDLTKYHPDLAGKFNDEKMPAEVSDLLDNNLFRTVTGLHSFEEARDMLGRGFFIAGDGSEGFASERDANGVSTRRKTWQHAMAEIGADDREETKALYGEPLLLIINSWGIWNKGPRDIRNSAEYVPAHKKALWISLGIVNAQTGNIMIPEGSFWAKWSDVKRRQRYAVSGANGWVRPPLPDYSPGFR